MGGWRALTTPPSTWVPPAHPPPPPLPPSSYFSWQVEEAYEEGDYGVAVPLLSKAFAIIDKNVKRNIVHKNTAARKKSQLALKVKTLEAGGAAAAEAAPAAAPDAAAAPEAAA